MEKLKLSDVKKRIYFIRIELGPYLGTERKRYSGWAAGLPGNRMVFVAQRNKTVLAQKIVEGADALCGMDQHKWASIFTGNALYHEIKQDLDLISRPMVKMCGDDKPSKDSYWHSFEVGHGTETLALWREQVLYVLEHKYRVRDWSRELPEIEASHQPAIEAALRAEGQPSTPEVARQTGEREATLETIQKPKKS